MLMQHFWVTIKEYYGMLWYFLEWSIAYRLFPYKPGPRLIPHCFTKNIEYGDPILEQESKDHNPIRGGIFLGSTFFRLVYAVV